jgi:hypothetical protein
MLVSYCPEPISDSRDTRDKEMRESYPADRGEPNMKVTMNLVGAVLVLFGAIWFLQGINVLPGSFMTGQIRWAVYGGIAVAAGISLLIAAKRRRRGW